jgi:DnaJ family protein B protein 12
MTEKNERKEKADILFKKAMDCYTKQEYEEALKFFKASINYYPNERAELFIKVCENNIPSNSNNNTNYKKSYSASSFSTNNTNNSNNNYNYSHHSSFSSQKSANTTDSKSQQDSNQNEDMKCKELLKKKDYYDILNIKKDATNEEIKRAYKKQAVKFHPDKNHSKLAEECFKKISEAYQCLSDPEKKKFYDKYGNEEEFRQRYYQAHRHYEEEMDPYDIFEILFGGGAMPRRGGRRPRHFHRNDFNVQFNDFGAVNLRGKSLLLLLVPFFLMIVIQILPELFSLIKPLPLYKFNRNGTYKYKKRTYKNNIEYFANDKFLKKYPTKQDMLSIDSQIENDYLNYIYDHCKNVLERKQELEYYMRYTYSRYERQVYKQQIERLNYNYCEQYNHLKNRMK